MFCGAELGLFSKPIFYNNYERLKQFTWLIKRYGVSSQPYFTDRSILRNIETYGIDKDTIWKWVKNAKDLSEFVETLYGYLVKKTSKTIWAEKTPENIFFIEKFVQHFPDAKIIHIVRDPRDVILSLHKRGHSRFSAAKVWLTSVASIQGIKANKNFLEIRYEDLIEEPDRIFLKVCSHLKIPYDMDFFCKDKYKTHGIELLPGFTTWTLKPTDGFSKDAVGQYKKSDLDYDELLHMRMTREFANLLGIDQFSIADFIQLYGYNKQSEYLERPHYMRFADGRLSMRLRIMNFLLNLLLHDSKFVPLVEY